VAQDGDNRGLLHRVVERVEGTWETPSRDEGSPVITDRLGSVRRGGAYASEKATYYPFGEQRTPGMNVSNQTAFATYQRDAGTMGTFDYAMNRYYAPQWGRFTTPDPYPASAQLANPQSWNRYSYVENDPVNKYDPGGLCALWVDSPEGPVHYNLNCWVDDGVGESVAVTTDELSGHMSPLLYSLPAVDKATTDRARGLLDIRLKNFRESNCWKVLAAGGVKVENIMKNYSKMNFYDVRSESEYANLTQSQIGLPSSDKTSLRKILGDDDAAVVGTLGSATTTAVLVGKQFFHTRETDTNRMNSMLHEMLHALGGKKDSQILNNAHFLKNGLVNKGWGDTGGITEWLARDCR
jgi:RHS repeat-associated protein